MNIVAFCIGLPSIIMLQSVIFPVEVLVFIAALGKL